MLQIRLSTNPTPAGPTSGGGTTTPSTGSGAAAAAAAPSPKLGEVVTVACPEHLVIADLPVAKSLGAVTASATGGSRTAGRRSRRPLGERVHICSRCDFPIAIYGRLIPCEHAFCLTCARSDASCSFCDERIQKIQSIKMMEGIFICAASNCLKSFLKRQDFESHVHEAHANLLQKNVEKEERNESDAANISKSGDTQKHSQLPEISTARAPTSSSQIQDREERSRHHHQSRDQTPLRPPVQLKQPPFHGGQPHQSGDLQGENNPPGFDRPYSWFPQPPSLDNWTGPPQLRREPDQIPQEKQPGVPDSPFIYPPLPPHQPNFPMPMNMNQPLVSNPSFSYPLPQEGGGQQFFPAPFQMQLPDGGPDQGSVLGIPPPACGLNFPEGIPRPWGMGMMGMMYQQMPIGQGAPEGVANPMDPQGLVFSQAGFGAVPDGSSNQGGGNSDNGEGKGVLAPMPMSMPLQMNLPPPPPLPSTPQRSFNRN